MKERNSIAPRLRKGEMMPSIPEGFVSTRVDGKIIGVSSPEEHDIFVGKSGYTERQLRQIDQYRELKREQVKALEGVRFELQRHIRHQEFEEKQAVYQADAILYDHYIETMPRQIKRLHEEQLVKRK